MSELTIGDKQIIKPLAENDFVIENSVIKLTCTFRKRYGMVSLFISWALKQALNANTSTGEVGYMPESIRPINSSYAIQYISSVPYQLLVRPSGTIEFTNRGASAMSSTFSGGANVVYMSLEE